MKKNIPYLFPMEYEMMMVFWNSDKPLTAVDLMECRKEGSWSKNSTHPLIRTLLEKGFLEVCGTQKSGKVNSRLFVPAISIEEYLSSQVSEVYENKKSKFNIGYFMASLLGDDSANDEKIINDLEEWIKKRHNGLEDNDNHGKEN